MEGDVGVRKLAQLIFLDVIINVEETTAQDSSKPDRLLRRDFSQRLEAVMQTTEMIIMYRWQKYFDTCYHKMFTSHEMYLKYIMYACQDEHKCHKNIFESFISVCAVLRRLSYETHVKTGMNFFESNTDIFMVFYKSVLKGNFRKSGGLQRFVEHILSHKYLEWNADGMRNESFNSASVAQKMAGELINKNCYSVIVYSDDIANDSTSLLLAQKVLSSTSVRLPTLLSKLELVQKLVEYQRIRRRLEAGLISESSTFSLPQKILSDTTVEGSTLPSYPDKVQKLSVDSEIDKTDTEVVKRRFDKVIESKSLEEIWEECSNSNSITDHLAAKQKDVSEDENIIVAVIRYNKSNSLNPERAIHPLQKQASEILEHMKETIISLIKVLDEYDEE